MKRLPEVMECYIMLGESDAMLRVVVADLNDYRHFQAAHLTKVNGIQNVTISKQPAVPSTHLRRRPLKLPFLPIEAITTLRIV
jgi:DNA-binding Lrp family transcriptional regulator